jgi:SAM-dependent methyltransferase
MTDTAAYDVWHAVRAALEPEPTATAPWHELAKRHVGGVGGKRVLEIGCGRGAFALWLAGQGAHVTAADFSPAAVDAAARLVGDSCDLAVADVQRIPYPDGAFDVVVSLETLEHVPDPLLGLRELIRVTKPGGRLVVSTPNYLGPIGVYRLMSKLAGKTFTEGGQPTFKPLTTVGRVWTLRRLGCKVVAVDGAVQHFPLGFATVPLERVAQPHAVWKWVAHHGITVAIRA